VNEREPIVGLGPTFESIQANVFIPICAGCHNVNNARNELILDEPGIGPGSTYDLLVGQNSVANSNVLRVDPNSDPNDSYLIQMLEGTAFKANGDVNVRMPLGGPFLSQTDIGIIRQWIADGALSGQEATFASIQSEIFIPRCNSCHGEVNPALGLQLGEAGTYAQLIGQLSQGAPDEQFVIPGEPDNSYLIKKLELVAPDIAGSQMPSDGSGSLPQTDINIIRDWISKGALEVE
jgi:hypothetical protein